MKKNILIAAVMFLALSVAAFAQASFTVSSIPVTTVASCGVTELTGNVILNTISGNTLPIVNGTITINYGVPITVPLTSISLTGTTASLNASLVSTTSNLSAGLLVISLTPTGSPTEGTVQVSGVRVNVSGSPNLTNLTASVSSTGNAITAGEQNVVVISSISTAIRNFGGFGNSAITTAATMNAVTGLITSGSNPVNVKLAGNFIGAFAAGATASQLSNQLVQLTFSPIQAGVSLTVPASATSTAGQVFNLVTTSGTGAAFTVTPVGTTQSFTSTSASLSAYYQATTPTASSLTALDSLTIPVTVGTTATATYPLPQGSITVTAQLAPPSTTTAVALTNYYGYIPSYGETQCATNAATILTVQAGQTVLLIPYAVNQSGFDTGIAIANTTADPGAAAGLGVAGPPSTLTVPQNGKITFYFYPQTGTAPAAYSTSATSPGSGLTATGVLNSGGTYSVLLSQLLAAAGFTGNFQGYVIALCNFTNGHGESFVSDFVGFSQGALMLVVPQSALGRAGAGENLNN
jgi:hypothetical protein